MQFFTFITVVAAVASAMPAAPKCTKKNYVTNFDNVDVSLTGNKPPEPYNGLSYTGFGLQSSSNALLGGLQPKTSPNTLVFGVLTEASTTATINLAQGLDRFNLDSVFFGCSVNAAIVAVGAKCVVTATAKKANGASVSTNLSFDGGNTLTKINFPKTFDGITSVTFAFAGDAISSTTLSATFDNLDYTTFKC